MINLTHVPTEHNPQHFMISGDNIQELINFCVDKIRIKSKDFYKKELFKDLSTKGESIIDIHAGQGNFYVVKLF